ncbi:hypothetical protein [Kingella sp. (in: b-proteobacteria)]|uniref:hypothetical protein n=1 Tax=Kingella sp. (in: b-proteobacteria) TaxID=2020713 RepID=UPI0026DD5531|nr:hypothetical protein [Kingella sp. (in: b-proteobacteria)]MDO4657351.1 hypothetical protein [Kingella sp. (in: b-proteobacteria)]
MGWGGWGWGCFQAAYWVGRWVFINRQPEIALLVFRLLIVWCDGCLLIGSLKRYDGLSGCLYIGTAIGSLKTLS